MRFQFFLMGKGLRNALDEKDATEASVKVLGLIGQAVPASFLLDIASCDTAKTAREALERLFKENNQADLYALETKWQSLSLEAKESVADYMSRARSL